METKWLDSAAWQLYSCWLKIGVCCWSLIDINCAHSCPSGQMDMVGRFWMYRGASTELEWWCLGRGKTLWNQSHHKKEPTNTEQQSAEEDIWHPWWTLPFPLTIIECINCVCKIYHDVYILKLLQTYGKGLRKMLNVWRSHFQFPPWEKNKNKLCYLVSKLRPSHPHAHMGAEN